MHSIVKYQIPDFMRHGVQVFSEGLDDIEEASGIKACIDSVTIFDQVLPAVLAEHDHNENQVSSVYEYVEMGRLHQKCYLQS